MVVEVNSIMECLGNPLKTRIIILMKEHGPLTPKQIIEKDSKMPQATVYRALKSMEECRVVKVVSETKVKAMVEKTYFINDELKGELRDLVKNNNGDAYFRLFAAFAFELLRSFEDYSKRDGIDIKNDGSGFMGVPVYATTTELEKIYKGICDILRPYQRKRSDDQLYHTFGIVTTPPRAETEE